MADIVDLFKRTGFEAWAFGEVFVYPRKSFFVQWVGVGLIDISVWGSEETQHIPLSMYVIADFDTEHGLELIKEALSSIVSFCFSLLFPAMLTCV